MRTKSTKKWFFIWLVLQVAFILLIVGINVVVDPYFHYHKPLNGISYRLYDERYINNGIAKHFDYNAFVTGTSMNQNFKTSEIDELFSVHSVKFPFSGGGYQEITGNMQTALTRQIQQNRTVKMVIWGIDYNGLRRDAGWSKEGNYPDYLYDDNLWNDTSYVLNKSILYHGTLNNLLMTLRGDQSTDMDEYSSWKYNTGLEKILRDYPDIPFTSRVEAEPMKEEISEEDRQRVTETVTQNMLPVISANPDTEFYFFFTPYSILYWDNLFVTGETKVQLEAQRIATELLVEYPNVRLYNFYDNFDLITNLGYYSDKEHYSAQVNSMMLHWMKEGRYRITKENKDEQFTKMRDYYLNFNYSSIYEKP